MFSKRQRNILGAFAALQKATISFVVSVCLSVSLPRIEKLAHNGRMFIKFDICAFFLIKSVQKVLAWLKSDRNSVYFTWRRIYTFDSISIDSS
jgi:hypothetical protein